TQRGEDADRHVALRLARLLRVGGDGVEADVGEEHQRGAQHDARQTVRRERRPDRLVERDKPAVEAEQAQHAPLLRHFLGGPSLACSSVILPSLTCRSVSCCASWSLYRAVTWRLIRLIRIWASSLLSLPVSSHSASTSFLTFASAAARSAWVGALSNALRASS